MKWIRKIWNDPVWSKVISFVIITLVTAIYVKIKSLNQGKTFDQAFNEMLQLKVNLFTILVGLFLVLIVYIIYRMVIFKYSESTKKSDLDFFNKVRNEYLDQDSTIRFLRDHNFRGPFNLHKIDDIEKFNDKCRNSDFKFINPRLEKLKIQIEAQIDILLEFIAIKTFPTNSGLQRIPPEWEQNNRKVFDESIKGMNEAADNICKIYDNLIKKGRKELDI